MRTMTVAGHREAEMQSDTPENALNDVHDMLCGVRDLVHIAEMASERLDNPDGNAFATVLSMANDRLRDAQKLLGSVRGEGDD